MSVNNTGAWYNKNDVKQAFEYTKKVRSTQTRKQYRKNITDELKRKRWFGRKTTLKQAIKRSQEAKQFYRRWAAYGIESDRLLESLLSSPVLDNRIFLDADTVDKLFWDFKK